MSVLERIWKRPDPVPEPDIQTVDADPLDAMLEVLSNSRRRAVVLLLDEGARPLDYLADEIAALEAGPDYDYQERKAAYVGVYQAHLPVLARHGIVREWNGNTAIDIEPGPNHELAVDVLAAAQDIVAEDGGVGA